MRPHSCIDGPTYLRVVLWFSLPTSSVGHEARVPAAAAGFQIGGPAKESSPLVAGRRRRPDLL